MGIFFQDKEYKSTKLMIVFKVATAILMTLLLIVGIVNGFDSILFKLIFIIAGIGSIFDSIERYLHQRKDKGFLIELGFAFIWFILAFSL